MNAILFCDHTISSLPVQNLPEALLPYCNIPLLAHILRFLDRGGVSEITLVRPDPATAQFADSLPLQAELHCADDPNTIRTCAPTFVLRRLCLPRWDMGELLSLCDAAPVRLLHPDGSPTHAELYPAASSLNTPETAVTAILSVFHNSKNFVEYRKMQQELLQNTHMANFRIGQGVRLGKLTEISERSVIGSDCVIGDHAVIEDCVLGDGVQIGAGAVLRRCVICRHALVDRETELSDVSVAEGEIAAVNREMPVKRRFVVDVQDGIHEGLPRWNTADTALHAGAAMTALGTRLAIGFDCAQAKHLALAAAAGALSQGAQVWNIGICALSQLIHAGKTAHCDALLWVHGDAVQTLTPYGGDGFPLRAVHLKRLQQALEAKVSARIVMGGTLHRADALLTLWESACREISTSTAFTVEICCGNPTLRETAQRIFSGGTGERIVLNLSEDGTKASAFSAESGMVSHDALLLLSLLSFRERGEALALPSEFHPAAEGFAAKFGGRIMRLFTPQVSPTAAKLYAAQGVCTDGILLFAHVLNVLKLRGISLAQAVRLLPSMHTKRHEISTTLSRLAVEKLRRTNPDRSVQIGLPTQSGRLELLAYAESMEAASELCGFWEQKIHAAEARDGAR